MEINNDGFDVAIRSHFSELPDSELRQRQINDERIILVAAPSYLAERKEPSAPEQLAAHLGLMTHPRLKIWKLQRVTGGPIVEAAPQPCFYSDESLSLISAAEAGLGIAALPEFVFANSLGGGRLRQILSDWTAGRIKTTILTPSARAPPSIGQSIYRFPGYSA